MKDIQLKKTYPIFQQLLSGVFDISVCAIIIAFFIEYLKPGFFSTWFDLSRLLIGVFLLGWYTTSEVRTPFRGYFSYTRFIRIGLYILCALLLSISVVYLVWRHYETVPNSSYILLLSCGLGIITFGLIFTAYRTR